VDFGLQQKKSFTTLLGLFVVGECEGNPVDPSWGRRNEHIRAPKDCTGAPL
jgi:hypothetical protein